MAFLAFHKLAVGDLYTSVSCKFTKKCYPLVWIGVERLITKRKEMVGVSLYVAFGYTQMCMQNLFVFVFTGVIFSWIMLPILQCEIVFL